MSGRKKYRTKKSYLGQNIRMILCVLLTLLAVGGLLLNALLIGRSISGRLYRRPLTLALAVGKAADIISVVAYGVIEIGIFVENTVSAVTFGRKFVVVEQNFSAELFGRELVLVVI